MSTTLLSPRRSGCRRRTAAAVVALLAIVVGAAGFAMPANATTIPTIAITSPTTGTAATGPGTLAVSGSATGVTGAELIVDATTILPVTVASNGTWTASVDLAKLSGDVELVARAKDATALTTVWSTFTKVSVSNPAAALPKVAVVTPASGAQLSGSTIAVSASVATTAVLGEVDVRVNGGAWVAAARNQQTRNFDATVDVAGVGTGFASIEARAITTDRRIGTAPTVYVALNGATPASPQRYSQDRAMWVWENASYGIIDSTAARNRLAAMMDDTTTFGSDPIKTIYFGVGTYQGRDMLRTERSKVAAFVTWARGRGYHVQAVIAGGTNPPYFGALPEYQASSIAEFQKVLDYDLATPAAGRFDGVNVDVEPYSLPQWSQAGTTLPASYLDLLQKLVQLRNASGLPMLVGPAIPRWFDSSSCCTAITWHGATKPLSDHVQDITDYVSIMDYRDAADGSAGMIAQAAHELAYADSIGKPSSVVIGAETKDLSGTSDPETVTFHEEGRLFMEGELDKVYAADGSDPAFGGIAMHDYANLLTMTSGPDGTGFTYPG